ncbi:unnamed protein product [Periconia digitata]|uniref:Uncharacterized protein n=1 Tax=Periconia digitata TaxID=1303443 RepID=A0A9W4XJ55_9PLEO|nr:unnamed protein product [Periconia digitata]
MPRFLLSWRRRLNRPYQSEFITKLIAGKWVAMGGASPAVFHASCVGRGYSTVNLLPSLFNFAPESGTNWRFLVLFPPCVGSLSRSDIDSCCWMLFDTAITGTLVLIKYSFAAWSIVT